jgi:hypothetical protein
MNDGFVCFIMLCTFCGEYTSSSSGQGKSASGFAGFLPSYFRDSDLLDLPWLRKNARCTSPNIVMTRPKIHHIFLGVSKSIDKQAKAKYAEWKKGEQAEEAGLRREREKENGDQARKRKAWSSPEMSMHDSWCHQ